MVRYDAEDGITHHDRLYSYCPPDTAFSPLNLSSFLFVCEEKNTTCRAEASVLRSNASAKDELTKAEGVEKNNLT